MSRLSPFGFRRLPRLAAALLLGSVMTVGMVPVAHATPTTVPVSCVGSDTVTYNPPLVNAPRTTTVTFTEDLDLCLAGGVTTADASASVTKTTSCTAVTLNPAATTYHWNTGASSSVNFFANVVVHLAGGFNQVTSTGTVTSGFDVGATAVVVATLPQLNVTACASDGVAQLTGPDTLTLS